MTQVAQVTYDCDKCKWHNIWTRDEIVRRGVLDVYRSAKANEDHYSLPCKQQAFPCDGRFVVAIERKE